MERFWGLLVYTELPGGIQNIAREARFFATRYLGKSLKGAGIHIAQPTCVWLSLIEHHEEVACSRRWPPLQRFVHVPDAWGVAIAEYFTVDIQARSTSSSKLCSKTERLRGPKATDSLS